MSSNRPIEDLKQDTGVSHPTCTLARPFLRVLFRRQGSALASLRFWSTVANRDLAPTSDALIVHPMKAVVSSVSSVEQTGVLRQRRSDSPFTSDHSARASRVSPPLILWNTAQPSSVLSVTTSTSTSNHTSTLHVHSIFKSADTQTVAVLLVRVRKLACVSETKQAARQHSKSTAKFHHRDLDCRRRKPPQDNCKSKWQNRGARLETLQNKAPVKNVLEHGIVRFQRPASIVISNACKNFRG